MRQEDGLRARLARVGRTPGRLALGVALALGTAVTAEAATFDITLTNMTGLSPTQQSVFTQAVNFWKSVITGYNSATTSPLVTGVSIDASGANIDGVGGTLGQAGPLTGYNPSLTPGYIMSKTGLMQFDTADLGNMESNGSLLAVIEHEMGHVLGFGTLWTYNGLYTNGTGQYTGGNALAAYKAEFNQPSATFVPVELGGGAGTANGHWNEVDGGSAPTGIVDGFGHDMQKELMTGWLNTPTFISNTTVQQFKDLGYNVAAVPLPAAVWLFASAVMGLGGFGARQRKGA
jgi:hypothetical protein